jgi:hypothetical protein
VIAEIVTVVLCAAWLVGVRRPLATTRAQV